MAKQEFQLKYTEKFADGKDTIFLELDQLQLEGVIVSSVMREDPEKDNFHVMNVKTKEKIDLPTIISSHIADMSAETMEQLNESIDTGLERRLIIYEMDESTMTEVLTMIIQYSEGKEDEESFLSGLKTGLNLFRPDLNTKDIVYEENILFTDKSWAAVN